MKDYTPVWLLSGFFSVLIIFTIILVVAERDRKNTERVLCENKGGTYYKAYRSKSICISKEFIIK